MDLNKFRALAHPVSDETWAEIQKEGTCYGVAREDFTEYAQGYVLYKKGAGFFPVAWWYAPVPHASLEKAEESLLEWWREFN